MENGFAGGRGKRNVLILSGSLGDGHRQAAEALAEGFRKYRPEVNVQIVDSMEWMYPYVHTLVKYCFVKGVEKAPAVYGYLYQKTRRAEAVSLPLRSFLWLGLQKMAAKLGALQTDEIVCTFPLAAAAVSLLKDKGLCGLPLITVITDHTDHSLWIHPHTDAYLVGSPQVKSALVRLGIEPSHVTVTGIPLRQRFCAVPDREGLRAAFGLPSDARVALVMGGGCGLLGDLVREQLLLAAKREAALRLVMVCGRNESYRKQLEEEVQLLRIGDRVRVLGFVADIHQWMAVSDVLVTKPGGLTTAEALAMKLPMLLTKPIPGQEEDNARFLEQTGAAVRAAADRGLDEQLLELLRDPHRLAAMRRCADACGSRQSARRAIEQIGKVQRASVTARTGRIPAFV
ncbi:MGDG synthase family glycosyltransferase [Paenibacillus silviterrae]|uniref:MGDG synthase family glycosyltransferase n=1 Tax=Paenibacillus silviterrae TaxID=3242194 RepID=UPI0025435E6A|nr:glycosyltransferase [Paenibacillus chinjuensis]